MPTVPPVAQDLSIKHKHEADDEDADPAGCAARPVLATARPLRSAVAQPAARGDEEPATAGRRRSEREQHQDRERRLDGEDRDWPL